MKRKLAALTLALTLALLTLTVTAGSASATGPRDYGFTSAGAYHGFATNPYTSAADCGTGNYYFEYEVHRYSSDTVTLEFWIGNSGVGTVTMWSADGGIVYKYTIGYPPPHYGTVAFWHVQSIAHHQWFFSLQPTGLTGTCTEKTPNAP